MDIGIMFYQLLKYMRKCNKNTMLLQKNKRQIKNGTKERI